MQNQSKFPDWLRRTVMGVILFFFMCSIITIWNPELRNYSFYSSIFLGLFFIFLIKTSKFGQKEILIESLVGFLHRKTNSITISLSQPSIQPETLTPDDVNKINKRVFVITRINAWVKGISFFLLFFSLAPIIFCDSGPASACMEAGGTIASGPVVGLILLAISNNFLKRNSKKSLLLSIIALISIISFLLFILVRFR